MASRKQKIRRFVLLLLVMSGGAYSCGCALWNMGKTAVYLHESTVLTARVVDMVQRPFESYTQAMEHGNLPWEGEVAYQATVSFTLPTTPVPIAIPRLQLPDLDNCDYAVGQEVQVIVPLTQPDKAHLYRWKFMWGADCMSLSLGLVMLGGGYLSLRRKHRPAAKEGRRGEQKKTPKPVSKPRQPEAPKSAPKPAPKPTSKPAPEEEFRLEATPPEPKKRTRKPKDPNAPARPRTRKKKEGGEGANSSTPRRRKKSGAA